MITNMRGMSSAHRLSFAVAQLSAVPDGYGAIVSRKRPNAELGGWWM
jgi:hypothetical protein